jgi:hypothetical protein
VGKQETPQAHEALDLKGRIMAKLDINHRTINFNNRILQLRTITSVAKGHGLKPLPFRLRTLAIAGLALLGGLSTASNGAPGGGLLISLLAGIFLVYAIKANLKPREYWILHLETASGSSNLLASSDEQAIDNAVRAITVAMEADAAFQQTVIINDSTIVNDAVIKGSVINGMAKSSI